jgi:hypothetical protein
MSCRYRRWGICVALILLAAASPHAHCAGGSYLVDDASVTPDGRCQVESWIRHFTNDAWEASAAPACTRDDVEFSFVATRVAGSFMSSTSFSPGLKWVAGDIEKKGWGVGVAATTLVTGGLVQTTSLYVPVSIALNTLATVVANAKFGIRERRGEGTGSLSGLSFEAKLCRRCTVLAEYYRNGEDKTLQAGFRWSPSETVSLDLIYGKMTSHRGTGWLTTGFNVSQ